MLPFLHASLAFSRASPAFTLLVGYMRTQTETRTGSQDATDLHYELSYKCQHGGRGSQVDWLLVRELSSIRLRAKGSESKMRHLFPRLVSVLGIYAEEYLDDVIL